LEVPKFREYDFYRLPKFSEELATYQAMAAAGIAPCYRGSAIFMHGDKPGLSCCKFATGILINLPWLRNAIFQELPKLQNTTLHSNLYAGALVSDRCTTVLRNLEGSALNYVRKNTKLVQDMVDSLHFRMLQAGVLHLDITAANIGCCFSSDYQRLTLRMLDFNKVVSGVCCQKLYSLPQAALPG
jgi:hypothetical protein